jgi:hypothetical protein
MTMTSYHDGCGSYVLTASAHFDAFYAIDDYLFTGF